MMASSPDLADVTLRRFITQANASYRKAGLHDMQLRIDSKGRVDHAPGAPADIQSVASPKGMTLMWKPGTDDRGPVNSYRVYRDGKAIATVRRSTWFTDPGAQPGEHKYEIRSIDSGGTEGGVARLTPRDAGTAGTPGTAGAADAGNGPAPEAGATQAANAAAGQQAPTDASSQAAAGAAANAGAAPPPQVSELKKAGKDGFQIGWKPVAGATSYGIWQNGQLLGSVKDPKFAASVGAGDGTVIQIDAVLANGTRTARTAPLQLKMGPEGLQVAVPQSQQQQAAAAGQAPAGQASGQAAPQQEQPAPAPADAAPATAPASAESSQPSPTP